MYRSDPGIDDFAIFASPNFVHHIGGFRYRPPMPRSRWDLVFGFELGFCKGLVHHTLLKSWHAKSPKVMRKHQTYSKILSHKKGTSQKNLAHLPATSDSGWFCQVLFHAFSPRCAALNQSTTPWDIYLGLTLGTLVFPKVWLNHEILPES